MTAAWRNHPWRLRSAVLVLAAFAVVMLEVLAPRLFAGIEDVAGDFAWRAGASAEPERRIVVVDIDESSLRDVGAWPWSRKTMARLSARLADAGVLIQVYDIGFADPKDGDAELRAAWKKSSVVVGQVFSVDPAVRPRVGVVAPWSGIDACPGFAPISKGFYGTAELLLEARPAVGHLTPRIESDGVVRKVPALICHEGRAYPSLALTAFWRVVQADSGDAVPPPDWTWKALVSPAASVFGMSPDWWLTSPSLPGLAVPVDAKGDLRVPYRLARQAFTSVSAADVLREGSDLSVLKGAIALVGATAFGMGDTVATPHASIASGLEVHAQTLSGLLDHRLPFTPARFATLQALGVLVTAVILVALARRQRGVPAKRLPLVGLALALLCWAGSAVALLGFDLWLHWAAVAAFALLASVSLATAEHALTRVQRERLSAHLGAYLPEPVARRLATTDPTGSLQIDQRAISVLVADIRNFSAFAAHRPPEETAAVLHAFCCIAVDVVEQHGGVVENVVGDCIQAVWNAYSECTDHQKQAMDAARELLKSTRPLLASSQPTTESSLVQPLALGIGLESGSAIVGSFGPARRRAHAALGEPVSVAARLQQMTADLSLPILVGPQMASSLEPDRTEALGEYLLEGLSKHYRLYVPTAWAELAPADPQWASAATSAERSADSTGWSRWSESTSAGPLLSVATAVPRDA